MLNNELCFPRCILCNSFYITISWNENSGNHLQYGRVDISVLCWFKTRYFDNFLSDVTMLCTPSPPPHPATPSGWPCKACIERFHVTSWPPYWYPTSKFRHAHGRLVGVHFKIPMLNRANN